MKPIAAIPPNIRTDRRKEKSFRVMNTTAVKTANRPPVVKPADRIIFGSI